MNYLFTKYSNRIIVLIGCVREYKFFCWVFSEDSYEISQPFSQLSEILPNAWLKKNKGIQNVFILGFKQNIVELYVNGSFIAQQ